MAYAYAPNVALSGTKNSEAFQHIRDFVCKRNGTYDYSTTGIGWTLHDAVYAVDEDTLTFGDYVVMYSAGEDGDERMYMKMRYDSVRLEIWGYTYWNNVSHTGGSVYYSGGAAMFVDFDNETRIYMYGDLNYVTVFGLDASYAYGTFGFFGCLDTPHLPNRAPQETTGALTAGSDVAITVGDSSFGNWKPGYQLIIFHASAIEMFTVKTNNMSTLMTADLVNSYGVGAKVCETFPYIVNGHSGVYFYYTNNYFCLINHEGTVSASCAGPYNHVLQSYAPGGINGMHTGVEHWHTSGAGDLAPLGTVPNMIYLEGTGITTNTIHTEYPAKRNWRSVSMASWDMLFREYI